MVKKTNPVASGESSAFFDSSFLSQCWPQLPVATEFSIFHVPSHQLLWVRSMWGDGHHFRVIHRDKNACAASP